MSTGWQGRRITREYQPFSSSVPGGEVAVRRPGDVLVDAVRVVVVRVQPFQVGDVHPAENHLVPAGVPDQVPVAFEPRRRNPRRRGAADAESDPRGDGARAGRGLQEIAPGAAARRVSGHVSVTSPRAGLSVPVRSVALFPVSSASVVGRVIGRWSASSSSRSPVLGVARRRQVIAPAESGTSTDWRRSDQRSGPSPRRCSCRPRCWSP